MLFVLPTLLLLPTKKLKYNGDVSTTNMEEELLNNIKKFRGSAELIYETGDYTSATILYFKTLFVSLDLIIFKKSKLTPKDHTERFKILQKNFPDYYKILDKYFHVYRNTYSMEIDKETCEEVRENVIRIIKENFGI